MIRRYDTAWRLRTPPRRMPIFRRTGGVCAFPPNLAQDEPKQDAQAWEAERFSIGHDAGWRPYLQF